MSKREQLPQLQSLLTQQRWAALATVDTACTPLASMVGYAMSETLDSATLHLSHLAAHTRNLLATPRAALVISAHDDGTGDPQQLPRATLQGRVEVIERESEMYHALRERYLQRLPDAAPLFDFPDFMLFRLAVEEIRFVGGFAQAFTYREQEWWQPAG